MNNKKSNKMATKDPVRLRQRTTRTGRTTLYLDIYVDGVRSYEYLRLYLEPENSRADKEKNRQTLQLAEAIRAKRLVEVRNGQFGFKSSSSKVRFFDYYQRLVEERLGEESKGNWGNWRSALQHLRAYEKRETITLSEITSDWVLGFREFLKRDARAFTAQYTRQISNRPLSTNSQVSYVNKLRACLRQAHEEGLIATNPAKAVDSIKEQEGTRMYLTIDEVQRLAQTECTYPSIKRAFLFSCLTGLRRSDVERLTWGDVHRQGDFTRIIFRQKKTRGQEYLDITPEAVELMGERGEPAEHVFSDLHTAGCTNNVIRLWVLKAGIQKDITFHCARHTFATMMLDLGTDIYTVSKLLGHRFLSTTQVYAKVMDKNKQEAVASIPSILRPKE